MKKIWTCKIGEIDETEFEGLDPGADSPLRKAVDEAYLNLVGYPPDFIFSGWGGQLTPPERAVVDGTEPSDEYEQAWKSGYQAALERYNIVEPDTGS